VENSSILVHHRVYYRVSRPAIFRLYVENLAADLYVGIEPGAHRQSPGHTALAGSGGELKDREFI
jgi:hypothetical protein